MISAKGIFSFRSCCLENVNSARYISILGVFAEVKTCTCCAAKRIRVALHPPTSQSFIKLLRGGHALIGGFVLFLYPGELT